MIPLPAVGVGLGLLGCPENVVFRHLLRAVDRGLGWGVAAGRDREGSLRALPIDAEVLPAVVHQPALVEELHAVVKRVFHGVDVEVLVGDLPLVMPAPHGVGRHRPAPLHHADLVDVVNAVVAEHAAAGPEKVVKTPDLPEQLAHPFGTGVEVEVVGRRMAAVAAERDQVAGLAGPHPLDELAATVAVPAHQPHRDLQPLGIGPGGEFDDPPRARPVHRDRLLHEHVHALLDRGGEVGRAEGRRRGQDHNSSGRQRIDGLTVGVEAEKRAVVGHVHPLLKLLLERPLHRGDPFGKHVGHGRELHPAAPGVEGVDDRTAPPAPAAHERCVDLVAARRMHATRGQTGCGWWLVGRGGRAGKGDAGHAEEAAAACRGL